MKVTNFTHEMADDKKAIVSLQRAMKTSNTLIFVHANWCPYTVQFYPIWNAFEAAHKTTKDLKVYKIDHVAIGKIKTTYPKMYEAMGDYDSDTDSYKLYFPTVVMFSEGKKKKYSPPVRSERNLMSFVAKQLNSTASTSVKRDVTKKAVVKSPSPVKAAFQSNKTHKSLQQEIDVAFRRLFKQ